MSVGDLTSTRYNVRRQEICLQVFGRMECAKSDRRNGENCGRVFLPLQPQWRNAKVQGLERKAPKSQAFLRCKCSSLKYLLNEFRKSDFRSSAMTTMKSWELWQRLEALLTVRLQRKLKKYSPLVSTQAELFLQTRRSSKAIFKWRRRKTSTWWRSTTRTSFTRSWNFIQRRSKL